MENVLQVLDLKKTYKKGFIPKKQQVLKGLKFSVQQGSVTGFLGGNGAGKTTTLKCLLGLAFPDEGDIQFFGKNHLTSEVKSRIGFLPERPYFYEYLTGYEFLKFYGQLSTKMNKKQLNIRIDELLKSVDLTHSKDKRLKDYSKGMLQKIGFAQALVHNPDFVILDEPMSGLDPDGRHYLSELIKKSCSEGKAVFFSSHLLHDVESLCDRLVVLKNGLVSFSGATSDFKSNMNPDIEVRFVNKSGELEKRVIPSRSELQKKIDELRSQNYEIYDIRENKMSLEQVFINLTLKKEE